MSDEKEVKQKKKEFVPVAVIAHHADTSLVQWFDAHGVRRCYVPDSAIAGGKIEKDDLMAGVEYGLAWDRIIAKNVMIDAAKIAAAMRNNGLWTREDLRKSAGKINGILVSMMEDLYKMIIQKAESEE